MKRYINCSDSTDELEPVYCDTVGELIDALKKFPRDTSLGTRTDWRTFQRCTVTVKPATGNYGEPFLLVDPTSFY